MGYLPIVRAWLDTSDQIHLASGTAAGHSRRDECEDTPEGLAVSEYDENPATAGMRSDRVSGKAEVGSKRARAPEQGETGPQDDSVNGYIDTLASGRKHPRASTPALAQIISSSAGLDCDL